MGPGLPGKPSIHVDGPDSMATCSIEREADGIYVVTYTPLEVGVYDVRVDWNDSPVPGKHVVTENSSIKNFKDLNKSNLFD